MGVRRLIESLERPEIELHTDVLTAADACRNLWIT